MVHRYRKYYKYYEQMSKRLLMKVKLASWTGSLSREGICPLTVKGTAVERNLWANRPRISTVCIEEKKLNSNKRKFNSI